MTNKASKNFTWKELECKGCKNAYCPYDAPVKNVHPDSLKKLQRLRDELGKPLNVTSGSRCHKHNLAVGGKPNSFHIATPERLSRAFDVVRVPGVTVTEFVRAAKACGFTGIGIYKSFIHIDDRTGREARW